MDKVLKAKSTPYGLVELRTAGADYAIYVAGRLKLSTSDLVYAITEFDKY